MGINGLSAFLKKEAPRVFRDIPLSHFKNTRVAIDGNNWIHTSAYRAITTVVELTDLYLRDISRTRIEREMERNVIDFAVSFMRFGITPVFVFDGPSPVEKAKTREARQKAKTKINDRIKVLTDKIRSCESRFLVSEVDMKELRSRICQSDLIDSGLIRSVKTLLELSGVPVVYSTTEGEKLCAQLAIENEVSIVWSTDSDNWMFGTPLTLKGKSGQRGDDFSPIYTVVVRELILETLCLESEEFVDFCIMCGLDYNDNFPGVGPVKAFDLIKEHRSIDRISIEQWKEKSVFSKKIENVTDASCLNHIVCRNLVEPCPSHTLCADKIELDFNGVVFAKNRAQLESTYPICDQSFKQMDRYVDDLKTGGVVGSVLDFPVTVFK